MKRLLIIPAIAFSANAETLLTDTSSTTRVVLKEKYGAYHTIDSVLIVDKRDNDIFIGRKFKPTLRYPASEYAITAIVSGEDLPSSENQTP